MTEEDVFDFGNALRERTTQLHLPYTDVEVEQLPENDNIRIRARCTDDPLLHAPPAVKANANGSIPEGPWNHRQILVSVVLCESEETDRPVLSTTVTYAVDADHANYCPVPQSCQREGTVLVEFNWEFDRETGKPGLAEMRDGDRLHYFSVLPPHHVDSFVQACEAEAEQRGL